MRTLKFTIYSFENLDVNAWKILESQAQFLSVFQTYSWARVLKSIGIEPKFFIVMSKDSPLLGLLMFKSDLVLGVLSAYEAIGGPLVPPGVDEDIFPFFASSLKGLMKRKGLLYFYWMPSYSLNLESHLLGEGFLPIPSATFVVDLNHPVETLWKNLSKNARWGVKKAKKMNVTVSEAKSWDDWRSYYRIYVYENNEKGIRSRSLNLHKSMFRHLLPDTSVRLLVAKHHGKIIAGSLFLVTPHEMMYYESASNARYRNLQPNNITQWHAILWAKEHGVKYYDLGGSLWKPEEEHQLYGVHVFKSGWGGNFCRYNSFALNKLYFTGRSFFLRSRKMQRLYYALEGLGAIKRFDRI